MPTTLPAPAWKFEWSLTTVAVLVGFASGFIAWGYTLSTLDQARVNAFAALSEVNSRLDRLEVSLRIIDQHELRITMLERNVAETQAMLRSIEASINAQGSDLRVAREVLQRLDKSK